MLFVSRLSLVSNKAYASMLTIQMHSISKLNTTILSVPNELTVAAANFNIDFSMMKVEAPKESHGVWDALSSYRRDEAEEGQSHVTARKLGALFEAIVPPIPNLIQAYGKRASAISSRSAAEAQKNSNIGTFAAQVGTFPSIYFFSTSYY